MKIQNTVSLFCAILMLLLCQSATADQPGKSLRKKRMRAQIVRVSLLNPDTRKVIPGYGKLSNTTVIDLANFSNKQLLLKARVLKKQRRRVRSMRFAVQGQEVLSKTVRKPFVFGGFRKKSSYQWKPEPGVYTISITPHSRRKGRGRSGQTREVRLIIVDSNEPVNSPLCSGGPDRVITASSGQTSFAGHCIFENINSIHWRQVSGASSATITNPTSLAPTISNLKEGTYLFQLEVQHGEGTFTDQVWVAVTGSRSNYNFTTAIQGPGHVVSGYPVYFDLSLQQTGGSRDVVYVTVSGLPDYATMTLPQWEESCCADTGGRSYGWDLRDTLLQVNTHPLTPPGNYTLIITVGSGGVIKTLSKKLIVEQVPDSLPVSTVTQVPAIPLLNQWEQNMQHFGSQWCSDPAQLTQWEGNVWYYDGTRVFYQIADYRGENVWKNTCINNTLWLYRDLIFNSYPGIQGWRVFPHGLYRHYQETDDRTSRNAILKLANESVWTDAGGAVTPDYSRETAYLIHAFLYQEYLGAGKHYRIERAVAMALGHLDQIARSRTEARIKPFMLGLTFEALIHYYEQTGDPRIPPAIKQAAEWLWYDSGLWNAGAGSFLYINGYFPGEDPPEPAPDLNLLIAPVYAWLYSETGDDRYRHIGDAIFTGGIARDVDGDGFYEKGACLACNGKFFSQSYRWSFDFVRWRLSPP